MKDQKNLQNNTQHHYQTTPFQWGQNQIIDKYIKYSGVGKFLKRFIEPVSVIKLVLDCGCGTGMVSKICKSHGHKTFALDLSKTSLKITSQRYGINGIQASNLSLPFPDITFDVVISCGVVHHTPNAKNSFYEICRTLKPNGILFLLIYRKFSIPYFEYSVLGKFFQLIAKTKIGKILIDNVIFFPFIPLIYIGKCIKFRTLKGSSHNEYLNYFYDRYMTPRASFHTRKEVENWMRDKNLEIIDYYTGNFGYHHNFICKKTFSQI